MWLFHLAVKFTSVAEKSDLAFAVFHQKSVCRKKTNKYAEHMGQNIQPSMRNRVKMQPKPLNY
jgi:hypothetical protein